MASRRIKVLFIIDYFHRTGGTERHLAHLVTQLPPEQFECAIVCFDMGPNPLLDEVRADWRALRPLIEWLARTSAE